MQQTLAHLIYLTGFTEQDSIVLRDTSAVTQQWADEIVTLFYDTLFAYEPTAAIFAPNERPAREKTIYDWYMQLARGEITNEFWQQQWLVGLVHIPRHVKNAYMFGAMSRIQQTFLAKCMEVFDPPTAVQVYAAFKRATDVIAGLISEGFFMNYVSALEHVVGIRPALAERLMDVEVRDRLAQARRQDGHTN